MSPPATLAPKPPRSAPSRTNPARVALDRDGNIQALNENARTLLERCCDDATESTFFSYIHRKNLRRVMWDLAQMAKGAVDETEWLLRLRTGRDRWRWYRARATNAVESDACIRVRLRPLQNDER